MIDLKPCPFCGGEVSIAETGYKKENCFFVTRGHSKTQKTASAEYSWKVNHIEKTMAILRRKSETTLWKRGTGG